MAKVSVTGNSVWFWCPGCETNHRITTDRWQFTGGENVGESSPSLVSDCGDGRVCHLLVRDGQIQYLGDSHHSLAGKTVPMEELS